jgi:hypothetical protein
MAPIGKLVLNASPQMIGVLAAAEPAGSLVAGTLIALRPLLVQRTWPGFLDSTRQIVGETEATGARYPTIQRQVGFRRSDQTLGLLVTTPPGRRWIDPG